MAQVMVNFQMDENLKKDIPFEIVADPFCSKANMERLEVAVADADAGINMEEHELVEVLH